MSDTDDGWLFVGPESEEYEFSQSYAVGGLCPVRLGDFFGPGTPPRYRIIYKLGYEKTIWISSVLVRNVALKLVEATSTARSQEPDVLKRLRALNSIAGQENHVIQLLDSFEHTSANGVHQVLVTELVIPSSHPTRHSDLNHGIAHGDLHPANFGIEVPEIQRFEELAFWHQAAVPPLRPLIPISPHCDPHSYPALPLWQLGHIVGRPLSKRTAYVVDGSAPPRPVTPAFYAAPEIVFPQVALNKEDPPWDQRSDIWSLGIAFHDLIGAGSLFPAFLFDDRELPHYMVCICGEVPDAWRDHVDSRPWPLGFAPDMTEGLWDGKKKLFGRLGMEDPPGLVRLMRLHAGSRPRKTAHFPTGIPRGQEADLRTTIQFGTVDFPNVVPSIHPLMQPPTGIPRGEGADLQTTTIQFGIVDFPNVVGSIHPLMQLHTGIPRGEKADLQTNRPNLPILD
ncbi:hypothetical protein C8J57DRAFT_1660375 [Mycena rebaudengoi]|nr:hypothetical protein C8J57DRAFT_1660375 [Mycena rebaudengoi]